MLEALYSPKQKNVDFGFMKIAFALLKHRQQ